MNPTSKRPKKKAPVDPQTRLKEIGDLIAAGASYESFAKEMDELLETKMEARDAVAEAAWEETYRNKGFEE